MYCSTCQAEACFGLNMPALLKALAISFTILLAAGISVQWQFFFGCSGHKGGSMWPGTSDSYLYKPTSHQAMEASGFSHCSPQFLRLVPWIPWKIIQLLAIWAVPGQRGTQLSQCPTGWILWRFQRWSWEIYFFVEVGTKESFFQIRSTHDFVASRDVTKDDSMIHQECSANIGLFLVSFSNGTRASSLHAGMPQARGPSLLTGFDAAHTDSARATPGPLKPGERRADSKIVLVGMSRAQCLGIILWNLLLNGWVGITWKCKKRGFTTACACLLPHFAI